MLEMEKINRTDTDAKTSPPDGGLSACLGIEEAFNNPRQLAYASVIAVIVH